jgi:phosphoglycolate phosphatase-like HAD superfamily hydrolase
MVQAIVFDFDGTVLESADIKTDAFRELFRNHPEHQDEIVKYHLAHAGISRYTKFCEIYRNILKQPLSGREEERLGSVFQHLIADRMMTCPLVPGVQAFLDVASRRFKCFIASGTPEKELHPLVDHRGLRGFFEGIHGSPKTKVEIHRMILQQYSLAPSQVLSIGDALSDLEAAQAEGIPFAGRICGVGEAIFPLGSTVALFRDFEELERGWDSLLTRLCTA